MKKSINYLLGLFIILFSFSSCTFISSFTEEPEVNVSLSFDKSKTSVNIGSMEVINLKASSNQNSASISWSYNEKVIFAKCDNYSAVITGLQPGTTTLTASCGSNSVSCVVTVTDDNYVVRVTNPYVYASTDYVHVNPNETVKISAALFGGTVADINGYSFTIDKPSVASLTTEGNYCWITGLNDGIAKISVKHNKAAYPYSVLVDCSSDGTNLSYITTTQNIITINLSESDTADFAVDLMNPVNSEYASAFTYSIVNSVGEEIASKPVVVSQAIGLNVTLKAYQAGECFVRCRHPMANYDLDILVRVIENAETAYIEPSQTLVTVSDKNYEYVTVNVNNYLGDINPSLFTWEFSENADEYIEYIIYNGDSENTGNNINIKGKKTGSVKATISYPGVPSRSIVILVRNITGEASDAECYITTSQNYIRMKTDDEPAKINITLKNGTQNDVNSLKWTVTNLAEDGVSKVISWESGNGSSSSRNVIAQTAGAYCVIKPLSKGTAYIDVSHPKALYSTRITVVVTDKANVKEEKSFLNFVSRPVVYIQNGKTENLSVSLSGKGNVSDISWISDCAATVSANETECAVTAPVSGYGPGKGNITVSHPDAESALVFTVVYYDTEAELEEYKVKSIWTYSAKETMSVGQAAYLNLESEGIGYEENISWNIESGRDCITLETRNYNRSAVVTGIKAGTSIVKASCQGLEDVSFIVNVMEEGIIDEENDCYLSTNSNVLYFEDINQSLTFSVDLFNIESYAYHKLTYKLSDSSFNVVNNNEKFTVTSLSSNASGTLTISHPLSQNELVVYLKSGERYEYKNEDSVYISTNEDVFNLYSGQEEVSLVATLNHTESSDSQGISKGFTFECEDTSIAGISYANFSNTCYIKPLKNGTTKIFVRHQDADFEKEVIVIVNNAPDSSTIPYITTTNNVITVVQGDYATATVSLMNCNEINSSLWKWTSMDSRIADVIANNGTSALLCANKPGTVEIKVTHEKCLYAMKILLVVLDSSVVTSRPYISTDTNIITLQKGFSTTLQASMIGGNGDSDSNYFRFQGSNAATILVNAVSGAAYIKGLQTGMAYITITNSRYSDSYLKTVLVIVEDKQQEGVYISTSQNIIKLRPTDKNLTTVSASLVNGEATDGKDFIWWCDDYNLIGITAVAEQCSIIPSGKTGTTKLHVKHAKASKQVDILVMVSSYDKFAFSSSSASINTEKLYFYPLQIPSIEGEYDVRYSSSNEDVCIIQGSKAVAWVCGLGYGSASLTATMVSSDGTVLATAEMLVSVTAVDPVLPVISLGDAILTVEAGTSRTLSASISGNGVDGTEKFNLKWSIKNKDNGISFLDETPDKTAYGSDVYVTFNEGGEYVITCEHEASGAVSEMYLIVEEKGEIGISLNTPIETVYKDDGSFNLVATLTNATEQDYKNISWSAVKVGGQNIVAVSKAKGATCTVTPKNVGQTTVIAKLPNGKTATCIVIVKANAQITFDLGSVHVIPGYTQVVNYKTNPENATVNFYTQMTTGASSLSGNITNYFSIEDDSARKQLRITGLRDYVGGAAGTVTASMVGASSANLPTLKVYVEYNAELRLEDMQGNNLTLINNNEPDTKNVRQFNVIYYPLDLEIDIYAKNNLISCISSDDTISHHDASDIKEIKEISIGDVSKTYITEEGIEKVCMTVTVIPHAECDFDMKVTGTLPSDNSGTYTENKSFVYQAYYDHYDIEVVELTQTGAFTKFDSDAKGNVTTLHLSDGEEAVFYFKIKNENASGRLIPLDEKVSDSWSNGSTGPGRNNLEYNPQAKRLLSAERKEKAKLLGLSESSSNSNWLQENITKNPENGLLYFYSDDSDSNVTVYHLGHAWDYYKDLPVDVQGDGWDSWITSYNYENNLNNLDVDYYLVTRELVYNGCYAVPHNPAVPMINVQYKTGSDSDDWWTWCCKHKYWCRQWEKIYFNGTEVFYRRNNEESGKWDNWLINGYKNGVSVNNNLKRCTPYVISKSELINNQVLINQVTSLHESHGSGFLFTEWGPSASGGKKLPRLIHPYITPTVSKDTDPKQTITGGKLIVKYQPPKGDPVEQKIDVIFEKRLCEAYTNGEWVKEWKNAPATGQHWIMKNFVDPGTQEVEPFFDIGTAFITETSMAVKDNPDKLYVGYEMKPNTSTASITVTIPSYSNGNLTLLKGYSSSVTESNGNKVYKITSHESVSNKIASGKLYFALSGSYEGYVQIESSDKSLDKKSLYVDVKTEDLFTVSITSKTLTAKNTVASKYSSVNTDEHLLIVGDGETIKGTFVNTDTSSSTRITKVTYEPLTDSSNIKRAAQKDASGKFQDELINCSVSASGFTVSHSKDYGYFADSSGVTDEFFSTKYRLSDITIDEDSVEYEKAYKVENVVNPETGKTEQVTVIDSEKTEKNRQKAIEDARKIELHKVKNTYANKNTGLSKGSYTFNYYYDRKRVIEQQKTRSLIPVGIIIIETDTDYTDEIIVCVNITENCCADSSSYSYAVPSSYYLNITE